MKRLKGIDMFKEIIDYFNINQYRKTIKDLRNQLYEANDKYTSKLIEVSIDQDKHKEELYNLEMKYKELKEGIEVTNIEELIKINNELAQENDRLKMSNKNNQYDKLIQSIMSYTQSPPLYSQFSHLEPDERNKAYIKEILNWGSAGWTQVAQYFGQRY